MCSSDLEGLAPFERIRDKVGDRIEVMLDGHGFFTMAAAVRIADAMAPIKPLWLEDILRPDSLQAMTEFRSRISVPVAVSEMLVSADSYRQILNSGAADYAMIDPTWVGGISAAVKLVDQAQICNIPALMHDCTGPMTLLAGVNVAAARTGVAFQETVRAHLATLYPLLIDEQIQVQQGGLPLPGRAGLGARWLPELFDSSHPGYRCSDLNNR